MISFKDYILQEGKQVGILYHYTSIESATKIAKSDMFRPMGYDGVSFTRDKHFHKAERHEFALECRFVINGNKLSHNYKIEPFNYFNEPSPVDGSYKHSPEYDEQEEVVKVPIRNIGRYIISLQIYNSILDGIYEFNPADVEFYEYLYAKFPTKNELVSYLKSNFHVELI